MTTISAKTIKRSRNARQSAGQPDRVVSSLLLRYPRWIHAEARTHRLLNIDEDTNLVYTTPSVMADINLSRNASSSRAIPVKKLIQDVLDDPAVPLFWGKNVAGMQANEELPPHLIEKAKNVWFKAMSNAVQSCWELSHLDDDEAGKMIGAHKQIVNRLLEPFSHITVVVTGTEWTNFLALRDHKDAEPHIAVLAREVRKCLEDDSTIEDLGPGEWHLPFVTAAEKKEYGTETLKKLSVARCASTSYKTVDGFDMTAERADSLFEKLVTAELLHASPMEHICQADTWRIGRWDRSHLHGNLPGFIQMRKTLPREHIGPSPFIAGSIPHEHGPAGLD